MFYLVVGEVVDVVFLDPMFPSARRKSALPKRRMQVKRDLIACYKYLFDQLVPDAVLQRLI